MIELKTFNKTELKILINSEEFQNFAFKPITSHRAVSQLNNPRANEDQTLLILAFSENKLAGYIGILPDEIYKNNEIFPCGWLSTLWIHPDSRGKKIAQKLLAKACDEYNGQILVTEFTPEAENMYRKSNYFVYQNSLEGRSYHLLSNLKKILPYKNEKFRNALLFLKVFDFSVNLVLKTSNFNKTNSKLNFKADNKLDKESEDFILQHYKGNSFNRNLQEIKWIINNPWILSSKIKDETYHFSDYCKNFEFVFLKIYKNNILDTILILSVRDTNAKLHFIYGNKNTKLTSKVLLQYLRTKQTSNFISFEKDINHFLDKNFFFYKKERNRNFIMHRELQKKLGNDFRFNVSAGDSDAIFT